MNALQRLLPVVATLPLLDHTSRAVICAATLETSQQQVSGYQPTLTAG
jgi:hypothetical protein